MKLRNSALKISILVALIHCILGNLIGAKSDNSIIQALFLPYSFIGGMSDFAGWTVLSVVLELVGVALMVIIFYPIGLIIQKKK